MNRKPEKILNEVFGYDEFRPLQKEIIESVLQKTDTMAIIPTGGGKSLCYQIPGLIFEGLTIVVSPLISLMKDQTDQLKSLDVPAVFLNSALSYGEYNYNVDQIKQGKIKLVYMAPEGLLAERNLNFLKELKVDCITVDEAHCISEWGHDFRPEYRKITDVRREFPDAVCLAFTATATQRVRDDILKSLELSDPAVYIASFNRENLFLEVVAKSRPLYQILDFLKKFKDKSGIIYCFSRAQVDELYEDLLDEGYSVKPYHAGLPESERKKNQELFIKDDVNIIVATIAFGMGIDKPNVRFVIHHDLPKSIESYYQEIGRAGRDGLKSNCLLLLGYGDTQKIQYFINQKEDDKERRIAHGHLDALLNYAESYECRRKPLLRYFDENYKEDNCGMCDNCVSERDDLEDISLEAKKFLSCVKRTGEFFGAGHIVDVLRGSRSQKVIEKGHDKLSTYGIGKEHSKQQWFHFSRQFLQLGLMEKAPKYGSLKLTTRAWDVFKDREQVMGTLQEARADYSKAKETDIHYDEKLFNKLKNIRKALADHNKLPPYAVFPDKTLVEMAAYFPQTESSLLSIHGVGSVKLNKFGANFLTLIKNYCAHNNIGEKRKAGTRRRREVNPERKKSGGEYKHHKVAKEFKKGSSILELKDKYGVKGSTILSHLYKYCIEGNSIQPEGMLDYLKMSKADIEKLKDNFDSDGLNGLRQIHDNLEGEYDYDEISAMRLYFMNS